MKWTNTSLTQSSVQVYYSLIVPVFNNVKKRNKLPDDLVGEECEDGGILKKLRSILPDVCTRGGSSEPLPEESCSGWLGVREGVGLQNNRR